MPKTKRTPQVSTRLAPSVYADFDRLCRMEGKTKTEIARKAITWYVENHEQLLNEERDTVIEKRLRTMENRMAGLIVKLGFEMCSMNHLFWTRTDPEVRKELFSECYAAGVKRFNRKLTEDEEQVKERAKKGKPRRRR